MREVTEVEVEGVEEEVAETMIAGVHAILTHLRLTIGTTTAAEDHPLDEMSIPIFQEEAAMIAAVDPLHRADIVRDLGQGRRRGGCDGLQGQDHDLLHHPGEDMKAVTTETNVIKMRCHAHVHPDRIVAAEDHTHRPHEVHPRLHADVVIRDHAGQPIKTGPGPHLDVGETRVDSGEGPRHHPFPMMTRRQVLMLARTTVHHPHETVQPPRLAVMA